MAKKPFHPRDINVETEDEPSISDSAKKLISLAEQFGKNLVEEVDKDTLLKLINNLRRKDVHIVNKALRGLGFDIDPMVYGALKKRASELTRLHVVDELLKIAKELESIK